jgi:hypothetical protein
MRAFETYAFLSILVAGCNVVETEPPALGATSALVNPLGNILFPELLPEDGGDFEYTLSMPAGANLWKVPIIPKRGAVCLDGSEPVMYVKAAPAGSPHENEWVFFIPGGGAVQEVDDVVATWFGENGNASFGEMSSRWAPPSIGPGGILDPTNVVNPFADFNMVFIHKCSYDRFMGRSAGQVQTLLTEHVVTGYQQGGNQVGMALLAGTQLETPFQGHDIVDAVVDTLADSTVTYDDGSAVTMPSLADAETVLFIGHSGGSRGATMIIDDVADHMRAYGMPGDIRFVMDAGFDPGAESVVNGASYPATSYPTTDPANSGNPRDTAEEILDNQTQFWAADFDATCIDNEADIALCADVIHVVMNWIETPLYVRQDLMDSRHATGRDSTGAEVADCWQTPWDTDPNTCYGDTFDMAAATVDQLADLALLRTQSLTRTVLGNIPARPSGFFPACGYHDGAHTDDGFYSAVNPIDRSYAEALFHWYEHPGSGLRLVESTVPPSIPTSCP